MPKDKPLQFSCRVVSKGEGVVPRDPKVDPVWHGDIRSGRLEIGGKVEE